MKMDGGGLCQCQEGSQGNLQRRGGWGRGNHTHVGRVAGGGDDFGWALGDGVCCPHSLGLERLTGYPFFASFFYQLLPESMDYIRAAPLPHVTPSLPWCCSI